MKYRASHPINKNVAKRSFIRLKYRMNEIIQKSILIVLVLLLAGQNTLLMANPKGGEVVMGQAAINKESDTKTTISQTSDKAVINWQQFNIGLAEHTQFVQPSKSAVTLNRVKGQDPSLILGKMSANGQVFLVNPNGIVFGKDSRIDVSALVASTADITNENFMAGLYRFNIPGIPSAQIINYGSINVEQGGLVALVAPHVYNQGYIAAKLGRVVLAGSDIFTLDLYGDDLISLQISDELLAYAQTADGQSLKQIVSNSGTIQADGGYVLLTTDVAKDVLDQVINMDGYIIAQSAEEKNGTIVLKGGDTAEINIGGTIDASATAANAPYAGEVRITAGEIIRLNPDAQVLAHGSIEGADGGFIAIAAPEIENVNGMVSVKALNSSYENGWLYIGNNIDAANYMRNPNLDGAGVQPNQATVLFEENLGQTDSSIDFLTRSDSAMLFLSAAEAVLAMQVGEDTYGSVGMGLAGINTELTATGENKQQSYSNYYIGNDPTKWVEGAGHYGAVRYKNIYDGIDLVYYGNKKGNIEYDLVVSEGADASKISFNYKGASSVVLNDKGDLVITLGDHTVIQKAPLTYQIGDEAKLIVPSRYEVAGDGKVGIRTDGYDTSRKLVVDPVVTWSSFLGGSDNDTGNNTAIDGNGNVFISGWTASTDFVTSNGLDTSYGGNEDGFVTKLSSNGVLLWSTYFGGANHEFTSGIVADNSGNAFIVGQTWSTDFNTINGFDTSIGGEKDGFVTKISANGSLIWSTYLGGSGEDGAANIAADTNGNVFVTGSTWSTDLNTSNGFDTSLNGTVNAFVTKFSTNGALLWSTYLGAGEIYGVAIATDKTGNALIAGQTWSAGLDTTNGFDSTYGGLVDAFVTKLSSNGSLLWSTYLGGSNSDSAREIATDNNGNVLVTGETWSTDFTIRNGIDTSYGGEQDGFVTKLSSNGSLLWSTYLGGNDRDEAHGIATDGNGNVFVTGYTRSTDFPTSNGFDTSYSGNDDAFVTKMSADGQLLWSTYLGGNNHDSGNGIAVDGLGNVVVAGETMSTDFVVSNGFDSSLGGAWDAFITKIDHNLPPVTTGASTNSFRENGSAVAVFSTVSITDNDSGGLIAGATIRITTGFESNKDQLLFTNQNGISGVYNPATGILQLTGNATLAEYQAAIRSIQFSNSSDSPSTANRSIFVSVNDSEESSAYLTSTVAMVSDNDAPTVSNPSTVEYQENNSSVAIFQGVVLADLDNAELSGATIILGSGFQPANDHLLYTSQNGISGSYNSSTGILQLTGVASIADYQNAIRSIKFNNNSDDPGSQARGISVVVNDGAGNSSAIASTVTLTAVNDAPVMNTSVYGGNSHSIATATDDISKNDGVLISELLVDAGNGFVSDVDNATMGIAVTNFDKQSGTWQYTLNGSTWTTFPAVSDSTAVLLAADAQTRIRFVPNNPIGTGTLSRAIAFFAWDGSSGANGDTNVNVNTRGGITAYSDAWGRATVYLNDPAAIIAAEKLQNDAIIAQAAAAADKTAETSAQVISNNTVASFTDNGSGSNDTNTIIVPANDKIFDEAVKNYKGQPELFFNSLKVQSLSAGATLTKIGDVPYVSIGGQIIDAMSVLEYVFTGNLKSAVDTSAEIAVVKMIPLIGQLTAAAQTGEYLAKKFDSMLTNQSYGAVVDFLLSGNISTNKQQSFTWLEAQEFLRSGVKTYGSGSFAIAQIDKMVEEGYLVTSGKLADKEYSLTIKGALAIYASMAPPKKDGFLGIYGTPTYNGVKPDTKLLNDLKKALTPSMYW